MEFIFEIGCYHKKPAQFIFETCSYQKEFMGFNFTIDSRQTEFSESNFVTLGQNRKNRFCKDILCKNFFHKKFLPVNFLRKNFLQRTFSQNLFLRFCPWFLLYFKAHLSSSRLNQLLRHIDSSFLLMRGHSFNTYPKSSEKLTFLGP